MDLLTKGLESQPAFPASDLSKANADMLSVLLGNKMFVGRTHEIADRTQWVFRVGHPTAVGVGGRIYDGDYIAAISNGVVLLEAMSVAVVGMQTVHPDKAHLSATAHMLLSNETDGAVRTHIIDAIDAFRDDMPFTTEVIKEAGPRFVGPLTDYAILGAALERELLVSSVPNLGEEPS